MRKNLWGVNISDQILKRLENSLLPAETGEEICQELIEKIIDLPCIDGASVLAEFVCLIETGVMSGKAGKDILPDLLRGVVSGEDLSESESEDSDGSFATVRALVEERGLTQISDPDAIGAIVDAVPYGSLVAPRKGAAAPGSRWRLK